MAQLSVEWTNASAAAIRRIARTCHAHPTLTEAIKEAALAADKRAINY